jgi:hypothetical protein
MRIAGDYLMNSLHWFEDGPYLKNSGRLADLLAAIQVLGAFEFAARDIEKWERRLGRKPKSANDWKDVFLDHPEFFTCDDDQKIALVWRRSFTRDYDTENKCAVLGEELVAMKKAERVKGAAGRISRKPLDTGQIELLCNLAIHLHEREIQHKQEKRWWIAGVVGISTALLAIVFD